MVITEQRREEEQQERGLGGRGCLKGVLVGEGGQVGTRGAAAGGGNKGGLIFTSEFCKLVYHVSSCRVPPQTVSHHLFQRLRQFVSNLFFFFSLFLRTPENVIANN